MPSAEVILLGSGEMPRPRLIPDATFQPMEFKAVIQRALTIRGKFASYEVRTYGREWTTEELALGLMKDVGDLAMLIQASEGVRRVTDLDQALGHELSDCLWSIIALADRLGIDLEAAFIQTMDTLGQHLTPDPS
jgi:NTP pyrophosphatase (non-canonical NTP hydrolase)